MTFEGHSDAVNSVAFSLVEQWFALASNTAIMLFNAETAVYKALKGHNAAVSVVAFHPMVKN